MQTSQTKKFHALLGEYETAALVTSAGEELRARPMAIAKVEENCDLWFITGEESAKVREIQDDSRIHVVCQNGWRSCISLSAHASLVRDRAKIKELWKASYRSWFPGGPDDPNIVLIRARGEHAEYWDNTGVNALSYAYQSVKALVTGSTPAVKEGDQHGQVILGTDA